MASHPKAAIAPAQKHDSQTLHSIARSASALLCLTHAMPPSGLVQNEMPPEALRATDPIHRKIEQLFHSYNLFYDRRKGYYREKGEPVDQIVSVIDVLSAMLSIVLLRPDAARARPKNYIKDNDLYASVFGKSADGTQDKFNLALYLKSIQIVRQVTTFLDDKNLELVQSQELTFFISRLTQHVSP